MTSRTRLLLVDQIASPTGFVFPVAALAAAARSVGVAVLVDAAHAPGQLDVDLDALDVDFWSGNLHKWVSSPRACAVLRVAERWHDVVRPVVASTYYADGFHAAFDWTGTFDPVPLLAVPAALEFWDGLGWDAVRRHQRGMVADGARAVAAVLGTRVAVGDGFAAAMRLAELPVVLDAETSTALAARLTMEHRVTAHVTGHQGASYVRMCGQIYNRPSDYERLATALVQELRL